MVERTENDARPEQLVILNQFGLPENWAYECSVQVLEKVRDLLLGSPDMPVLAAFFRTYRDARTTNERYPGVQKLNERIAVHVPDLDAEAVKEQRSYFSMSWSEKISFLYARYPRGMTLKTADGSRCHIKWEPLVAFELWVLHNHGQTLLRCEERGGRSPVEIIAASQAIQTSQVPWSEEQILADWRQQGMLTDA